MHLVKDVLNFRAIQCSAIAKVFHSFFCMCVFDTDTHTKLTQVTALYLELNDTHLEELVLC